MAENELPKESFRLSDAVDDPVNAASFRPPDLYTPKTPEIPGLEGGLPPEMSPENIMASKLGIDPGMDPRTVPPTQNVSDLLQDIQVNGLEIETDPFKFGKVIKGDFRDHNLQNQFYDRYAEHGDFDRLGFTPFRDNEALYNAEGSFMGDLGRAAGQWATLTGLGFQDALGFGDLSDRETAAEFEKAMAIGSSGKGGVSGFTTNLFLNSGYTVGIMGELVAEELVLAAAEAGLTAATVGSAGAASPLLALNTALMASRITRGIGKVKKALNYSSALKKTLGAASDLGKALDSLKDINTARKFYQHTVKGAGKVAKGALNVANPLENVTDLYRSWDKLGDIGNVMKTAKTFGAAYRDVRNLRLAYGEGALEGGMVQNKMERELLAEFKESHGRSPNATEAAEIRTTALAAGHSTALWNMPLILYSNKMTFDGLVRGKFKNAGSQVMKTGYGRNIFYNPKKGIPEAFQKMPKEFHKKAWAYIRNPKTALKSGIDYSKANFAEGIQELGQETVSGWMEDVHTAQYTGDASKGGYYSYLANNMAKQVSFTGAETFLSGFLMGGLIAPVSNTIASTVQNRDNMSNLYKKYFEKNEYRDIQNKRDEQLAKDINMLNEFYADPRKYLSPDLSNMISQKQYQKGMKHAKDTGDSKMYHDMEDGSVHKHVDTALRYGRLDTFIELLEDMKNPNSEEMQELAQGKSSEEFVADIDKTIAQAREIEKRHKYMHEKFPNPHDPNKFKEGSLEQKIADVQRNAWDKAIEEATYSHHSFNRALERQEKILSTAYEKSGLKNTPYTDINMLFNIHNAVSEIDNLNKEIETGKESEAADVKAFTKKKIEKRDKLKAFVDAMTELEISEEDEGVHDPKQYNKAKKAFTAYIASAAKESRDHVDNDKIEELFKLALEHKTLDVRAQNLNGAVNMLLDPKHFLAEVERAKVLNDMIMTNRRNEIEASLKEFQDNIGLNDMVTALADEGMFFKIEDLKALKETGKVPDTFYYIAEENGEHQVVRTSADYQKAIAALNKGGKILHNISIPEIIDNPYLRRARVKTKEDTRTYEDLMKQYVGEDFDPKADSVEVPLRDVLEAVMKSPFSNETEKALAEELLKKADPKETVKFSRTEKVPGRFSETEQVVIDPRHTSHDYKHGKDSPPIEHIILKEEVGRRLYEQVGKDKEFTDALTALMKEANDEFDALDPAKKAALGVGPISFDEQGQVDMKGYSLMEFAKLAMTNPHYQKFLAGIKTKNETNAKSTWAKFVDSVLKVMTSILGKRPSGSVLNATLDLITSKIDVDTSNVADEATGAPSVDVTNMDAKIADIEKRRQEELDKLENRGDPFKNNQDFKDSLEDNQELQEEVGDEITDNIVEVGVMDTSDTTVEFSEDGYMMVTNIIKPGIVTDGKLTQRGKVDVKVFDSKEAADKWLVEEKEKIKKSRENKANKINAKYDAELVALEQETADEKDVILENAAKAKADREAGKIPEAVKKAQKPKRPKKSVDAEMVEALVALGYEEDLAKNIVVSEAQRIIDGAITIDEMQAEGLAATEAIEKRKETVTDLRIKISKMIMGIKTFDDYLTVNTEVEGMYRDPEQLELLEDTGYLSYDPDEVNKADGDPTKSRKLDKMLEEQREALRFSVSFDNFSKGEYIIMKDGSVATVVAVNKDSIQISYDKGNRKDRIIPEAQIQKEIEFKSERFIKDDRERRAKEAETVEVTKEEEALLKQTAENAATNMQTLAANEEAAKNKTAEEIDNSLTDIIC